jgi:hypothetical protein
MRHPWSLGIPRAPRMPLWHEESMTFADVTQAKQAREAEGPSPSLAAVCGICGRQKKGRRFR